jgi:hypothetical protein
LQSVEAQQIELVRDFQPDTAGGAEVERRQREAAMPRNRSAYPTLCAAQTGAATAAVKSHATRTKVDVVEAWRKKGNLWSYTASYESLVRRGRGEGLASSKKEAKKVAHEKLLAELT